jgi:hypothetical protein
MNRDPFAPVAICYGASVCAALAFLSLLIFWS